jgi:hypothetical protein
MNKKEVYILTIDTDIDNVNTVPVKLCWDDIETGTYTFDSLKEVKDKKEYLQRKFPRETYKIYKQIL